MTRGEVWWASLPAPRGSAPGLRRPVVIVQADAFNRSRIRTLIVAAVTTNRNLAGMPRKRAVAKERRRTPGSLGGQRLTSADDRQGLPRPTLGFVERSAHGGGRCRSETGPLPLISLAGNDHRDPPSDWRACSKHEAPDRLATTHPGQLSMSPAGLYPLRFRHGRAAARPRARPLRAQPSPAATRVPPILRSCAWSTRAGSRVPGSWWGAPTRYPRRAMRCRCPGIRSFSSGT